MNIGTYSECNIQYLMHAKAQYCYDAFIQILTSVKKELMDVITTALILLEAIIVLVWMDMNWDQIITLVQVIICMHTKLYNYVHV